MDIQTLCLNFAQTHPKVAAALMVIGTIRLTMKPAMTALHEFTKQTPTEKDDLLLQRLEASRVWRSIAFLIDLLGSVKLPAAPGPGGMGIGKDA